jgi:anti-sigma B factor antagonist
MAQPIFEAKVRFIDQRAIIDLFGEINAFADGDLSAAYNEAVARGGSDILLNFSGVDYINSTGIALIVGTLAKARQAHRNLLVCGLSEHYLEIFHITRLADFMKIYPDEESALQAA